MNFRNIFGKIEHFENKTITYFKNKAGPGVLQPSVQQIRALQVFQRTKTELRRSQYSVLCAFGILGACILLKDGLEQSTAGMISLSNSTDYTIILSFLGTLC